MSLIDALLQKFGTFRLRGPENRLYGSDEPKIMRNPFTVFFTDTSVCKFFNSIVFYLRTYISDGYSLTTKEECTEYYVNVKFRKNRGQKQQLRTEKKRHVMAEKKISRSTFTKD